MGPLVYAWPEDEAEDVLVAARAEAAKLGLPMSEPKSWLHAAASAGIIQFAAAHKVDHIVMGTGDKRGLSRLMLGSVAADVAARAPCSVTIAR